MTKKEKGIISGHLPQGTGVGGFLRFAVRTLRSTARSMRLIPIKHRDAECSRHFLKFRIASALLLSVFSVQIAWAVSDERVIRNEQDSSRPTIVSESRGIKEEASANPSIKVSTQEGLISLDARDADLREVLDALSRATGVQIIHGNLEKSTPIRITVSFKNLPFDKAIKTVTNQLPAGGYALFEESGEAKRVFVITKKGQTQKVVTDDLAKVRKFLSRRWDSASFEQGLSLLKNRSISTESRILILDKLRSKRRELSPETLMLLFKEVTLIAKDPTESPSLATLAVRTMTSLARVAEEAGQITKSDVRDDFSFLAEIASDESRDAGLRGAAIRAAGSGYLEVAVAKDLLRGLLTDESNLNRPKISRNTMLAMRELEGKDAIGPISEVLRRTQDPSIFGTAAFSLGQIKTVESMAELVQHEDRFPDSASSDAALVDMEEIILDVLNSPQDDNLIYAIDATRHLWREGQRERFVPLLQDLLMSAPISARKAALDRLLKEAGELEFEAEKSELRPILTVIADQPELNEYAEQIRRRLSATVLAPTLQTIPTPGLGEFKMELR